MATAQLDLAGLAGMSKKKPPDDQEPSSETARIATDLMEMMRDICFHSRDEKNRRLKLAQYLDGLLRPVVLREYEAFQKRNKE